METSENLPGESLSQSISSAAATHVSHSHKQGSVEAPRMSAIFGLKLRGLLAYYDHDSCCWKTSQGTFLSDLETFSGTWPDSGMMRNGSVYELRTSAPAICESASSSWPTAQAHDATGPRGKNNVFADHHYKPHDLAMAGKNWATPNWHDGSRPGSDATSTQGANLKRDAEIWQTPGTDSFRQRSGNRSNEMGLDQQARFFPTPSARDWKSGQASDATMEKNARPLNEIAERFPSLPPDPQTNDGPPSSGNGPTSRRRLVAGLIRVLSVF